VCVCVLETSTTGGPCPSLAVAPQKKKQTACLEGKFFCTCHNIVM